MHYSPLLLLAAAVTRVSTMPTGTSHHSNFVVKVLQMIHPGRALAITPFEDFSSTAASTVLIHKSTAVETPEVTPFESDASAAAASSVSATAGKSSLKVRFTSLATPSSTLSGAFTPSLTTLATSTVSTNTNDGTPSPSATLAAAISTLAGWHHYLGAIVAGVIVLFIIVVGIWLVLRGNKYKQLATANGAPVPSSGPMSIFTRMRAGLPFRNRRVQQANSGGQSFNALGSHLSPPEAGSPELYNGTPLTDMTPFSSYGHVADYSGVADNGFPEYPERSGTPEELPRRPLRVLNPDAESSMESLAVTQATPQRDGMAASRSGTPINPDPSLENTAAPS